MWIEAGLNAVAYAAAIIATLRAGSRAAYLHDHEAIGVMDGPPILPIISSPPRNDTNKNSTSSSTSFSPLYEISELFRHCVRLELSPTYYHEVRMTKTVSAQFVPYPLSQFHDPSIVSSIPKTTLSVIPEATLPQELTSDRSEDNGKDSNNSVKEMDKTIQENKPSLLQRMKGSVGTRLKRTKKYAKVTPKVISYWTKRAWYYKSWNNEIEVETDENDSRDWDYNMCMETDIQYNSTEGIPRIAELSVYAPETFEDLRSAFGVPKESFHESIFKSGRFVSFQSNSKGAARAGGVFFFTRDGAYMIKTIKSEEAKTLLEMLPKYHKYMKRHVRKSLLTRFCGMYNVRIRDAQKRSSTTFDLVGDGGEVADKQYTFLVMNAVFPAESSKFISERFDLKGSTVGRELSEEERRTKGKDAIMKDLDLAREVELVKSITHRWKSDSTPRQKVFPRKDKYGLNIGSTAKAAFMTQLRSDVKFLAECQVMDYSLLSGIVNVDQKYLLAQKALSAIQQHEKQLKKLDKGVNKKLKLDDETLYKLSEPIRLLLSPSVYILDKAWSLTQETVSSIITLPLPYYGASKTGVYGGTYSIMHGTRHGDRAIYYMGLIDFLQPWTAKKVMERQLKGIMGYDKNAISCVTPEEYASRFLEFIDAHVS